MPPADDDCPDGVWGRRPPRKPKVAEVAGEGLGDDLLSATRAQTNTSVDEEGGGVAAIEADRKSLIFSLITLALSIPALIGAWCWPALVIGLFSAAASAGARTFGHWISFALTAVLMLVVNVMLFRDGMWGNRWSFHWLRRFGPFFLIFLATPLILADIVRHLIQDAGAWAICANNNNYNRINSSDPYPSACTWSSMQYACTTPCCVPVWLPTSNASDADYAWFPKQSSFYPANNTPQAPFATLRPDGSLFYPAGFDHAAQPFEVYDGSKPLLIQVGGALSTPTFSVNDVRGTKTAEDCYPNAVNEDTGYCMLSAADLDKLGGECNCDACAPETMAHLSAVGILFSISFTYLGFALLAVAVLWNANIIAKLSGVRRKWKELRGNM